MKSSSWIKEYLLKQQEEIRKRLESLEQQHTSLMEDMYEEKHSEDLPVVADNFSMGITIKENAKKLLEETSLTLQKLEQGSYGVCESCGEEISKERLEVKPTAINCQHCL